MYEKWTKCPNITWYLPKRLPKCPHFIISARIGGVDLKTILNKILKFSVFPPCAFADMKSWWGGPVHKSFNCFPKIDFLRKIYLSGPQWVRHGLIRLWTPKSLPTPAVSKHPGTGPARSRSDELIWVTSLQRVCYCIRVHAWRRLRSVSIFSLLLRAYTMTARAMKTWKTNGHSSKKAQNSRRIHGRTVFGKRKFHQVMSLAVPALESWRPLREAPPPGPQRGP